MKTLAAALCIVAATSGVASAQRWRPAAARDWYSEERWLVGSNYIPATAVNQLEMWQADTFDPQRIDLELGWAEETGMNTLRVGLDDLVWRQDPEGFRKRIEEFLKIANKHKMRVMFVLFDSTGDPSPHLSKQPSPEPGVLNSRWVQSPDAKALADPADHARLETYVRGLIGAFANDKRILAWDLWNEPDDSAPVAALLPKVYEWARAAHPRQPLTSGLWQGDWSDPAKLRSVEKIQIDSSDLVSFHYFGSPEGFAQRAELLDEQYNRPVLCTDFLARPMGSTIEGILPVAKDRKIAVYMGGLVVGKTQMNLPPDSRSRPYTDREPPVWWQDVFRTDGQPYRHEETGLIRTLAREKTKR